MRLAELLAELPSDQLERLAAAHLGQDENVNRGSLCITLEGVLRSYSFVRQFVGDRFPPTFSILEVLLDADGCAHPAATFRDVVTERTKAITARVASGELIGRDDGLRLYRRVLVEARRNDLVLDASETAILGVLRRELVIRPIEHFLVEHHTEFHEFWAKDDAFLDEMQALRSSGLVFGHAGSIMLAEEVVPLVRQTLGFEMSNASRRRLYERFSGGDLADILGRCSMKTGGSRDEKLERLLASYVQPTEVLRMLGLQELRGICRDSSASVGGSKDELVERLVDHFLHNIDLRQPSEVPPPTSREPEPRVLDATRVRALFSSLTGNELSDILAGIDSSRVTGAKETKLALVISSPFAELTLLEKLTSRSLEEALGRLHLRSGGSKHERAERLIEFFRAVSDQYLVSDAAPASLSGARIEAPPANMEGDRGEEPPRD